jgi:hypothetical protein
MSIGGGAPLSDNSTQFDVQDASKRKHDSFTGKKLPRNFKKDMTNSGASKAVFKSKPY